MLIEMLSEEKRNEAKKSLKRFIDNEEIGGLYKQLELNPAIETILKYAEELEKKLTKEFKIDLENKAIKKEQEKQIEELKQKNEVLEKIIDLMSLDIYKFSKGHCNNNIREKEYINDESVKLDYIRLLKEEN